MTFTIEHNPEKFKGVNWITYGMINDEDGFCRPATGVEVKLWAMYLQVKLERDKATEEIAYMRRLRE